CSGRAAEAEIERSALGTDGLLDLDADGRIKPLQMRAGADDQIDFLCVDAGILQRGICRLRAELCGDGKLVVVARRNMRGHPVEIEDTFARIDVAALDPRCVMDEI